MTLVDLKLPKKHPLADEKPDIVRPNYPWGLQLTFEQEQIAKLPMLKKAAAGDMVAISGLAKVTSVEVTDKDKEKKRHTVRMQIQKIGVRSGEPETFAAAFDEATKSK